MMAVKMVIAIFLFLTENQLKMVVLIIKKKPNDGNYVRCSKTVSFNKMTLDSIEMVMKNQRIPNAINLFFLN